MNVATEIFHSWM